MKTRWIEMTIVVILLTLVSSSLCFGQWDNTLPADNSVWNNAAKEIRDNWDALEAVFGVDLDLSTMVLEFTDVNVVDLITSKTPMVDIRAFLGTGYVTDGSIDYTTEIQAAFDTADYNTVFIPPGIWQITSTIDVGPSTSVTGVGFHSRILATACDAFSIPISGSLGGTEWSKIQISGDSASAAYHAIEAPGDADAAFAAGVTFRKLYINKIGTAFFLRGLSYARIVDCAINDVWNGIHIEGQCVRLQIIGNDITRDLLGTGVVTGGAGNPTGIIIDNADDYNPGGATTKGPESVMIAYNSIAAFGYGINLIDGMYVQVFSNDLDRQTVNGIFFVVKNGTLTIRDNWVNVFGAAAMYGIQGGAYPPGVDNDLTVLIEHNRITAITSPHVNSVGIKMGTNQNNVITRNNDIEGFQLHDIHYTTNKGGIIEQNRCASTDPPTYSIVIELPDGGYQVSENDCEKAIFEAIPTLDNTGTPSIKGSNVWLTGGTVAITDFDDGQEGDVITIIGGHNVTITDGAHLVLAGSDNFLMNSGDTLMLIQAADTKWYQLSESNNN